MSKESLETSYIAFSLRKGNTVGALAYSPDGRYLAIADHQHIQLYDGNDSRVFLGQLYGYEKKEKKGRGYSINWIQFINTHHLIAAVVGDYGADYNIYLWDIRNKTLQHKMDHENEIFSLAVSPDGTKIISGSKNHAIRLWDVARGRVEAMLDAKEPVHQVGFTPQGLIVANLGRSEKNKLIQWDPTGSGKPLKLMQEPLDKNVQLFLVLSKDGRQLITAYGHTLTFWPIQTSDPESDKKVIPTHEDESNSITALAISPDGRRLALGNQSGEVQLWDVSSEEPIQLLENKTEREKAHLGEVTRIGFDHTGHHWASSSSKDDSTLCIWDSRDGHLIVRNTQHKSSITAWVFNPNGDAIVSGSADGFVYCTPLQNLCIMTEPKERQVLSGHPSAPRLSDSKKVDSVTDLSKLTAEREAVLDMIQRGQGSHHSSLDNKFQDLNQVISIKETSIYLEQENQATLPSTSVSVPSVEPLASSVPSNRPLSTSSEMPQEHPQTQPLHQPFSTEHEIWRASTTSTIASNLPFFQQSNLEKTKLQKPEDSKEKEKIQTSQKRS